MECLLATVIAENIESVAIVCRLAASDSRSSRHGVTERVVLVYLA